MYASKTWAWWKVNIRELKGLKFGDGEGCLISKMDRFQNEGDYLE